MSSRQLGSVLVAVAAVCVWGGAVQTADVCASARSSPRSGSGAGRLRASGASEAVRGSSLGSWGGAAPEGGATLAAFQRLRRMGWIEDDETVVLFITGSGHKYSHLYGT